MRHIEEGLCIAAEGDAQPFTFHRYKDGETNSLVLIRNGCRRSGAAPRFVQDGV